MQLDRDACWERLRASRRAVLGTIHPQRGIDLVPVVYVVVDGDDGDGDGARRGAIVIPIDTVKAKTGVRLQRLRNLEADPRASLLVDHYDDDWTRLWWVRAHGPAREVAPTAGQLERLAATFPAYAPAGSVPSVIRLEVEGITGWSAGAPSDTSTDLSAR